MRARWSREDLGRGLWAAVITEIPYQVQKSRLIEAIAGLIGDREFVGAAWMRFLAENDIPFILRIKENVHVRPDDGRRCTGASLFRKLHVGGRRYQPGPCPLGSPDKCCSPPVALAATRLPDKSLLIVATNTDPRTALAQ